LDSQELFHAVLKNASSFLYFITCAKDTDCAVFSVYEGSMRLWHYQIEHIGPRTIDLIEQKGFVNKLDLTVPNDYDHVCTGYAHGKSHRKSMPGTSNTKYGKMELVVMDLTGPISVPTWDGYVYALVIVEVSCRYPVGRLLKSKEEVRGAVRDVIAMLER